MGITRREAKEIVDWVIQEIMRRRFPYVTDGKLDLSKSPVGTVSGTQTSGGPIAESAIWDRHVAPDADIRGTKIRVATTAERGTVQLGTEGEALVPTMSGLLSTVSGLGASLVGIYDGEGEFVSEDVESALHELFAIIGALTFVDLTDTPSNYTNRYPQVPTIIASEAGLEWRPVDYYDGESVLTTVSGAVTIRREKAIDAESATMDNILDGGLATDVDEIEHVNGLGGEVTIVGGGINVVSLVGQSIVITATETPDVSSLNGLVNDVLISGQGLVGVSEVGQTIVLNVDNLPDVDSLNGLTGVVVLSGEGTVHISEDGQIIVISGSDEPYRSYWDDLRTPVNMLKFSDTKPPVWTSYKGGYVAAFEDQAVNYQSLYWAWQLPHEWEIGTAVVPHIHIVPEDGGAGNVHWEFTYSIAKKGATFPVESTIHITQAMPEQADEHTYFELVTISGVELGTDPEDISTMLLCSLSRRSDQPEDTYAGKDVYLLEVDMHYLKDSWGSRLELSK